MGAEPDDTPGADVTATESPWPELARGRASAVYDLGDGRVLRRNPGSDPVREAAIMEHARRHGIGVPSVHEAHGHDLVMELVAGPTLLEEILAHPERLDEHAALLAALHAALDDVPAPPLETSEGDEHADRLVHLDLHPANVICSSEGPVLVDWTNAGAGSRAVDVATTWLILACHALPPGAPAHVEEARQLLTLAFVRHVDRAAAMQALPTAAQLQLQTPALSPEERARVATFLTDILGEDRDPRATPRHA